ncbi:hypothetical protein J5N97_028956 [Dioscorea zingiberensis]|uniref:Phosphoglycerate mutase n=1 Tax=Dioscorea zingiberensis TaxID=325984 RepID=A0A9D5C0L2_9LILI|nr:hypothetical protein J5N97_028956 [Dioscorea zingiberensis]
MAERAPLLRNSYWVLRHGKSIPNERGLIVSSPENGTLQEYGLAPEGIEQAKLAGELFNKELKEKNVLIEKVCICYSPFSRTTETAKEVASALGIPFEGAQCKVMEALQERYFGPLFELFSHDKYTEIWALDAKDPFMSPAGGESVADVASRLATALTAIESQYEGCTVLVVSHGDPLQILQTVIHAAKEHSSSDSEGIISRIKGIMVHPILSHHRKFALLTGELRRVF